MKKEVSKREYKGEKYWNFNLKDSILKFVEEYKEKPCISDKEHGHECTKTPLHLSYIYVTETKDGMFLRTFAPSKVIVEIVVFFNKIKWNIKSKR